MESRLFTGRRELPVAVIGSDIQRAARQGGLSATLRGERGPIREDGQGQLSCEYLATYTGQRRVAGSQGGQVEAASTATPDRFGIAPTGYGNGKLSPPGSPRDPALCEFDLEKSCRRTVLTNRNP